MNVNCVICSDLFTPVAEVYLTKCGHMFHYTCLVSWLERCDGFLANFCFSNYWTSRKKTCPHCRNSVTEKSILRVYFNVADVDGVSEDVGTLVNKIDNLQFQITLNEKDIKQYKEKAKTNKNVKEGLRYVETHLFRIR